MAIAIVIPTLNLGGAERVSVNFANELASRGMDVDLIVFSNKGGDLLFDVSKKVRIFFFGIDSAVFAIGPLLKYIINNRPEYVITMLRSASYAAGIVFNLPFKDTIFVIREAGLYDQSINRTTLLKTFYRKILTKLAYRSANGFISNSQDTLESFTNNNLISAKTIKTVIGNPVIGSNFTNYSDKSIDHPWFYENDYFLIVSAGRLDPIKDFNTLIQAVAIAANTLPNIRLIIIGEGEERQALSRLIDSLGISDKVLLAGFKRNPGRYFSQANLYVSSSISEGFGNTIVEAMASGCNVICTDCPGGPKEILQNGKYGALIPVGNSKILAEAIINFATNEPRYPDIVERAMDFTIEKISSKYFSFMKNISKKKY
jgi:glycosyltransferase involved in cell wall biosynthesis